jgi:hypothetical protein
MVGAGLGGDIGSNRQQVVCAAVAYWLEGQSLHGSYLPCNVENQPAWPKQLGGQK